MKLISMTEFVLNQENPSNTDCQFADKVMSYANFLKQPLQLWMFVPCDEDGNLWRHLPTEEERIWAEKDSADAENSYKRKVFAYQQAKERVLFEGFEYDNKMEYWHDFNIYFDEEFCENKTIEDIVFYNLILTQTAIKQIGL